MKKSLDDVSRLCDQCGLKTEEYRTFSRAGGTRVTTVPTAAEGRTDWTRAAPASPASLAHVAPIEAGEPRRRSLLHALVERNSVGAGRERASARQFGSKNRSRLSLLSAAGGVGTTTILATLAALYTRKGMEVLLVDGDANSILPLYFGLGRTLTGVYTLRTGNSEGEGLLHIASRAGSTTDNLGGLVDVVPHLLSEISEGDLDGTAGECWIVLVPDIRCLVRAAALRERCEEQGLTPHFLINQFDKSQPLHQEIRSTWTREFGSALLPFAIRRSSDMAAALADGKTVADLAPEPAVVSDFRPIIEWLAGAEQGRVLQTAAAQ